MRLNFTFDTNALINRYEAGPTATSVAELVALLEMASSGAVDGAVTTRVAEDLGRDKDPDRRARILRAIEGLPVIGSVFRLDVSPLDGLDTLADGDPNASHLQIERIIFPNLLRSSKHYANCRDDIDHVIAHYLAKRDIFVTDDGGIMSKQKQLADALQISVMRPGECLLHINRRPDEA